MFPYLIAGVIGYGIAKLFEEDESPKYDDGGSVLLAPNGKPSNLTPEQYKLVRKPEFKAWFGDWENSPETSSKVVDENGEPLPVYHGSNIDFNVFENKPREIGRRKTSAKGFYFTKDKWSATQYAGSDGFVKSYFLKILNYPSNQDKEVLEYSNIDDYLFDYGKTIDRFGYDGAIDVQGDFIVWNPEQIKLADGTNTTFDGNNPDIRYAGGGKVDVIDIKQYNVGKRNYRFVEIAEKKYNKIELYRQSDDGNYYGNLLYRRVPRYNAEFSSPMVNDMNQLYAYEPVSNEELFNAVKNKTKPFASFGYWLSYYTEEEIQKEIQSFIDECDKYDLEYAVEKISGENKSLERIQFQVCQKGTFDELFDINALIEDYANNDFDSYDIEKIEEFRYVELSYFLNNEWDEHYALTGLILGIPPKFTMALINMWTSYGLAKDYKYDNEVIIM